MITDSTSISRWKGGDDVAKRETGRALLGSCLALVLSLSPYPALAQGVSGALLSLIQSIPGRPDRALQGSEFARRIADMRGAEREEAIKEEITQGNIPDFLRRLKPVQLSQEFADGLLSTVTVFVMSDYLAIGSDKDFVLVPMNLYTAVSVAAKFGCVLPTRKVVDAIFAQSDVHLAPEPMPAGPRMSSTAYYVRHNEEIAQQRASVGALAGSLISGHKKDVVLSERLIRDPFRIAIYGWHRLSGIPIQPLSTVHGATYVDYSHGVRLVSETVLVDGEPRSFYDVLADPRLSHLLSDEGGVADARQIFAAHLPQTAKFAETAHH
jgi:hypothetical protein